MALMWAQPGGTGQDGAAQPVGEAAPCPGPEGTVRISSKRLLVGKIKLPFSELLSLETHAHTDVHVHADTMELPHRRTRACVHTTGVSTWCTGAPRWMQCPCTDVHTPVPQAKGGAAGLAWCCYIPQFCKCPSVVAGLEEPWPYKEGGGRGGGAGRGGGRGAEGP